MVWGPGRPCRRGAVGCGERCAAQAVLQADDPIDIGRPSPYISVTIPTSTWLKSGCVARVLPSRAPSSSVATTAAVQSLWRPPTSAAAAHVLAQRRVECRTASDGMRACRTSWRSSTVHDLLGPATPGWTPECYPQLASTGRLAVGPILGRKRGRRDLDCGKPRVASKVALRRRCSPRRRPCFRGAGHAPPGPGASNTIVRPDHGRERWSRRNVIPEVSRRRGRQSC